MVKKITLSKGAIAPSRIFDIEPSVTLKWLEDKINHRYWCVHTDELLKAATTQAKKGRKKK